ncbi:TrbG/VirB9 family P-type conjugative transfer protein [Acidithiobacillus sp.]|uniref:TrbG/VirB9 family P-type conjugative transfer protein n=1 Tax=Acidithiobacillus sp. TaxID=1872118 RepID=UPI003CFD6A96
MRNATLHWSAKIPAALILGAMTAGAGSPASLASTVQAPSVSGQSAPVARTVNTVEIFQRSLDIHYGQPIRAVERQSVQAFEQGTMTHLPVFTRPGGEVIVPLGQVLPILQTAPGNFSVIVLGKGVRPVSLAGAPSAEWVVKEAMAGKHPILEIMPRFPGLRSSIQIVATSPHGYPLTYTVGLVSGGSRFTPVLSFYRIPHVLQPSLGDGSQDAGVLARSPSENPYASPVAKPGPVNAAHANLDWSIQCFTGDCKPIRPSTVISGRKATYLRLPTKKAPMVLVRNRSGKSLLVGYRMDGHTLVVDAVPYRIDLIAGSWNHLAEVRLTHETTGGQS